MRVREVTKGAFWVAAMLLLSHCQNHSSSTTSQYVYLSTGTTYAGAGVAMSAPSQLVTKFNMDGTFNMILADYNVDNGDTPVSMLDYDNNHLLVAVYNASGSRLELVAKDGSGRKTYLVNAAGMAPVLKSLNWAFDGGILLGHSAAIDKFDTALARVTNNAVAYISNPAAPCATANTNITGVISGPGNQIVYTHGAASPNNLINVINPLGYSQASDCYASTTGPTANSIPTSIMWHGSGYVLVSFGSTTGPTQNIYSYTVAANSIGGATLAAQDPNTISGVSYMAEMPDTTVLISNADANYNSVEQFSFDPTTQTMTHVGSNSFIYPSLYTKSISAIVIGN